MVFLFLISLFGVQLFWVHPSKYSSTLTIKALAQVLCSNNHWDLYNFEASPELVSPFWVRFWAVTASWASFQPLVSSPFLFKFSASCFLSLTCRKIFNQGEQQLKSETYRETRVLFSRSQPVKEKINSRKYFLKLVKKYSFSSLVSLNTVLCGHSQRWNPERKMGRFL